MHQVLIFEGIVKKPLEDVTAATADHHPWCWSHLPRRLSGIRPSPYTALIPPIWSLAHSGSGAPSLANSTLSLLRKLVCEMRGFVALSSSGWPLTLCHLQGIPNRCRPCQDFVDRSGCGTWVPCLGNREGGACRCLMFHPVCPSVRRVQGNINNNPVPQRTSIESHGERIHVSCRRQLRNRSQTSVVA